VRCINDANIETALHMLDTSFDVIVMWHVIEHLTNPWLILEEITRKLKPEGVLVIAAPNPEALPFKTFGKYWTHLDAPRHLELIPKQLLSDHAHRYGLEEIFSSTKDKASIVFSSFGWWMVSFRNAVRDILHWPVTVNQEVTDTSPPRKINSCTLMALARSFGRFSAKAIRAIIMMVLRIFYKVILQPLERTEGRGNAYTVVYRKSR